MRNISKIIIGCLFVSSIVACSTQLKVVTQPEKATVYVINNESGEKKKIGVTPIDKKDNELRETLGNLGKSGEFVSVLIEKEEYQSRTLWLPVTASGSIASEISLQLKKDTKKVDEINSAKEVIDKMFLAQRFARSKQFERALIEVDKILENFPDFARAMTMKASIYYAKGDFKESLEWYEKAIEVDSELKDAVEMAAEVRKRMKLPAVQYSNKNKAPGAKR